MYILLYGPGFHVGYDMWLLEVTNDDDENDHGGNACADQEPRGGNSYM